MLYIFCPNEFALFNCTRSLSNTPQMHCIGSLAIGALNQILSGIKILIPTDSFCSAIIDDDN
jgi:hypothetical protein